jgi:cobalamin biosynthesis Mg chelatase CobN
MDDDTAAPASNTSPDGHAADAQKPSTVSVTGVESSEGRRVEMVEGETGAKIPAGTHQRSRAVPDTSGGSGSNAAPLLVVGALVVVLVVILVALLL